MAEEPYTPTTAYVREVYAQGEVAWPEMVTEPRVLAFDRWFAAEIAKAQAEQREADNEWYPGRWWSVYAPNGTLWCETSDEDEAREATRLGDTLYRQYVTTPKSKLVVVDVSAAIREGEKQ